MRKPIVGGIAALWLSVAGCVEMPELPLLPPGDPRGAVAIVAGGCFWCVEQDFEKLPGVIEAVSGYTGGSKPHPSYEEVADGETGHTEAVRIVFDPDRLSYAKLLDYFWRHIDPTARDAQFCDHGPQYRSGIYWLDEAQRQVAEASRQALLDSGRFKVVHTEVAAAGAFWPAEAYHQDYYRKNPYRYAYYRFRCGRDARLAELWGPPPADPAPAPQASSTRSGPQ